jgi:signal transduction histidine kinase/CheY-like chemotaxis protein
MLFSRTTNPDEERMKRKIFQQADFFELERRKLRNVLETKRVEFYIEHTLIAICCGFAALALQETFFAWWFIAHFGLATIERAYAINVHLPRARDQYLIQTLISFMVASIYAVLPIVLWEKHEEHFYFAALAIVSGSVLNTFVGRRPFAQQLLLYAVPNIAIFLSIAYIFAGHVERSYREGLLVVLVAVAISTYVATAIISEYHASKVFMRRRETSQQDELFAAMGRISSGVAHDFNNVLAAIQGCIEVAQLGQTSEERSKALEEASKSVFRGRSLTQQIVRAGSRRSIERPSTDVADLLRNMSLILDRTLPAGIVCDIKSLTTPAWCTIDEGLLQSIVLNLVTNARDALGTSGRIEIELLDEGTTLQSGHSQNERQGHRFVTILVRDNGPGIAHDIAGKIFDLHFSTKDPTGRDGRGLGLNNIRMALEEVGGDISFASTEGSGCEFRVRLLRSDSGETSSTAPSMTNPGYPSSGSKTVLLVEDNPQLLESMKLLLSRSGIRVDAASDGEQAVLAILGSKTEYDALITDWTLPGRIQGDTVVSTFQQHCRSAKTVIISGIGEQIAEEYYAQVPANTNILSKPARVSEILNLIR